jgi:hypothetical protein
VDDAGAPAGADEGNVIHARRQVRHQVGNIQPRPAMLLELARAGQERRVSLGELADRHAEAPGQRLAMAFLQFGLGVEKVNGAWPTDHEHEDDGLGLGGKMGRLTGQRIM